MFMNFIVLIVFCAYELVCGSKLLLSHLFQIKLIMMHKIKQEILFSESDIPHFIYGVCIL